MKALPLPSRVSLALLLFSCTHFFQATSSSALKPDMKRDTHVSPDLEQEINLLLP